MFLRVYYSLVVAAVVFLRVYYSLVVAAAVFRLQSQAGTALVVAQTVPRHRLLLGLEIESWSCPFLVLSLTRN